MHAPHLATPANILKVTFGAVHATHAAEQVLAASNTQQARLAVAHAASLRVMQRSRGREGERGRERKGGEVQREGGDRRGVGRQEKMEERKRRREAGHGRE